VALEDPFGYQRTADLSMEFIVEPVRQPAYLDPTAGQLRQQPISAILSEMAFLDIFRDDRGARDWRLALGAVENRPAILVYDSVVPSSQPMYFMLLAWEEAQVALIRDYRYVSYVIRDAAVIRIAAISQNTQ
jgi:hypothetical protein